MSATSWAAKCGELSALGYGVQSPPDCRITAGLLPPYCLVVHDVTRPP
jgi:hypothetical protein